ncbi:MAG: hypothetical protein M2R45_00321 [Verrucomicrobia subdivision 3 bacterium]|nr:hypothetical protein [Limisphaerales bacterium]MCS1412920.1 hypothetical protein [Limisphaerales bacterium]
MLAKHLRAHLNILEALEKPMRGGEIVQKCKGAHANFKLRPISALDLISCVTDGASLAWPFSLHQGQELTVKRIVSVELIGLSCLTALAQTNWLQFRGLSAFGRGEDGAGNIRYTTPMKDCFRAFSPLVGTLSSAKN